eukprot:CAMPEP_0206213106 /NCGR_PEP_ID=MMETSP0047_2-20121206/948_1 /ASSEMBLY_ACC=CAM_ASM_000192 /TAXON_ID=195065 /ORGANISM="Chroomonas mesostigmatica_cf, Strain CCMP1168" /LENGTH=102 /DNA_ID=CAMNT_0053635239 /DNA_START=88 /DNA_END=396 /DNA_ORIENTATION=+
MSGPQTRGAYGGVPWSQVKEPRGLNPSVPPGDIMWLAVEVFMYHLYCPSHLSSSWIRAEGEALFPWATSVSTTSAMHSMATPATSTRFDTSFCVPRILNKPR